MHDFSDNQKTVENLIKRNDERNSGKLNADLIKTALVVQGGTLRSVASCGAAAALNDLGLTNAFDSVYGSSSGSVNAAYFLTEQATLGITVYTEDVNNRQFLNFFRFWKIIDLEYFFNEIINDRKKHNTKRLISHPSELKVLTTDLDTKSIVWFNSKDRDIDIYEAMKASCALPLIYGRGVDVGGRSCIDGFIQEPLPVITPLHSDYTDILVLMTTHISNRRSGKVGPLSRFIIEPLIRRELGPELFDAFKNRWQPYNWALDILMSGIYRRDDGQKINVAFVCPSIECETSKYEMDAKNLAAAAYSSWRNTHLYFGVSDNIQRTTFDQCLITAKEKVFV